MKSLKQIAILITTLLISYSCSNDDNATVPDPDPFVVAFKSLSTKLTTFNTTNTVNLVYSEEATTQGSITISITETNAVYGTDYTTTPVAVNQQITLPITSTETTNSFVFNKINSTIDENANITFTITDVDYNSIGATQGNTTFQFNNSASLGGSIQPEVGGPNEPNIVFVDLSNHKFSTAQRDIWDLEFYGGNEFRVGINSTISMMVAPLSETNIDAITSSNTEITTLQPLMKIGLADEKYIDSVTGEITGTAIGEISATNADNPVYLINLGFDVPNTTPEIGRVKIDGDARGWKKIRILRNGNNYILQYADLDDTTHQEITIAKKDIYNFTFFSFNTNSVVNVEPEATQWDLGFSTFTNVTSNPFGPGLLAYGFSDFVIHNTLGGVEAYLLDGITISYDDFTVSDIDNANFSPNQNIIGSSWRIVFTRIVKPDIFYIVKDPKGNIYKIRFTTLTNADGERGYPEFEYKLLE